MNDLIDRQVEPEVGEWVDKCGAVIPHIMRRSYIGKKVVMDKSTSSHKWFRVGVLEKVVTGFYYDGDKKIECDMLIIFDGSRQRNIITHWPGREIYECLPWDAYERRPNEKRRDPKDSGASPEDCRPQL